MISKDYIKLVVRAYDIKQNTLVQEWQKVSNTKRFQSALSRKLASEGDEDSFSLIKALSNLTNLSLDQLGNQEIPEGSKLQKHNNLISSKREKVLEAQLLKMEKEMKLMRETLKSLK